MKMKLKILNSNHVQAIPQLNHIHKQRKSMCEICPREAVF